MIKTLLCILVASVGLLAQDRIMFENRTDGNNWDIFLMNADGSWPRNLTHTVLMDSKNLEPAISPNGKMFAFSSNRGTSGYNIFVMDLGTRLITQITNGFPELDHSPTWSPDGRRMAFSRCNPDFTICDIFTVAADGTGSVVPLANSPQDDDYPRFSPDGSKVVFESNRSGSYEIYTCDAADGQHVQQVTTDSVDAAWPQWSPDGAKIIFSSTRNGPVYELYMIDANGSNLTRLTHSQGNGMENYQPAFSSDGRRVAWSRWFPGSSYEIVEASLEAMDQPLRLTFNNVTDICPAFGFVTRKFSRFH